MTRGDALLVAGYALAIVPAMRLPTIVRERDARALAQLGVLELGHVLVAAGWAVKGRRLRALVNVAAVVVYPVAWVAGESHAARTG